LFLFAKLRNTSEMRVRVRVASFFGLSFNQQFQSGQSNIKIMCSHTNPLKMTLENKRNEEKYQKRFQRVEDSQLLHNRNCSIRIASRPEKYYQQEYLQMSTAV
jgi:hypothetical protein